MVVSSKAIEGNRQEGMHPPIKSMHAHVVEMYNLQMMMVPSLTERVDRFLEEIEQEAARRKSFTHFRKTFFKNGPI